ncbi:hypothetical protein GDO86_007824 [Hymenochirus boettgeri]|uniref:Protein YIPF n=1 Tax=Hymenochirus boettgeri TaxID=247094 RepID=A0A8T2J0R4_9PIPI|nr:hypothetical protein GDO86_007824 [Hymenochirus boettgeri]
MVFFVLILEFDDAACLLDASPAVTTTSWRTNKKAPFWTFDYYQTFFELDTSHIERIVDVLNRIKGSVLHIPGRNFIRQYVRSNTDLCGNLSNFLLHQGKPKFHYVPEFRKVSIAATAIYAYAWLVPLALWGFLTWRQSKVMSMVSYSFLEIVCVYGYSLFIYIPTSIMWIIHIEILRWILMTLAMCLSGAVLMLTFWPAVREENRRVAFTTLLVIMVLHALLAVGFLEYFFDVPEENNSPYTRDPPNITKGIAQAH